MLHALRSAGAEADEADAAVPVISSFVIASSGCSVAIARSELQT